MECHTLDTRPICSQMKCSDLTNCVPNMVRRSTKPMGGAPTGVPRENNILRSERGKRLSRAASVHRYSLIIHGPPTRFRAAAPANALTVHCFYVTMRVGDNISPNYMKQDTGLSWAGPNKVNLNTGSVPCKLLLGLNDSRCISITENGHKAKQIAQRRKEKTFSKNRTCNHKNIAKLPHAVILAVVSSSSAKRGPWLGLRPRTSPFPRVS